MRCTYCGTELPVGALFCGECGRAVAQAQLPTGRLPRVPVPVARPVAGASPGRTEGERCEQCGSPMAADDIFCGECGHVSRAVSDTFSRPRDTVVIDRIEALAIPEADDVEPAPAPVEIAAEPPASEAPGTEAAPAEENSATAAEPKPPVALNRPQSPPFAEAGDIEATRIVRKEAGIRFVLQFSTGESFTVYGTGLVGRNPKPEPGEYVDQVVRVLDPSRSVSKTHLEFGQEDGTFWIADRFSGNGTIAREPESPPVRCEPNTRHRISRGTRVEIGEQFFIVS